MVGCIMHGLVEVVHGHGMEEEVLFQNALDEHLISCHSIPVDIRLSRTGYTG